MKILLSSALPYANASAHIGHTFEFVLADVFARHARSIGKDIIFNVGMDEHGEKIAEKAKELGYQSVQSFCDSTAEQWKEFCSKFDISYDNFYRTTDSSHRAGVHQIFNRIKDFIEKKEYAGNYCVNCESFLTDKDVIEGKCPSHPKSELKVIKENNLFFQLSDFEVVPEPDSLDFFQLPNTLVDKSRSDELYNNSKGEYDFSISRENGGWGIDVPGEENQVFYCWSEAILNYPIALGYASIPNHEFEKAWSESTIIIGKDITKFHAYILPAIMRAAGIKTNPKILVHGIVLDQDGNKMSKSLGNVIDPIDQLNKFGLDPVRYYLTFGLNTFGDSKYSENDLINLWNSDVVNGFGNLVSRTNHLIDTLSIDTDTQLSTDFWLGLTRFKQEISGHFSRYDLKAARLSAVAKIAELNQIFQEKKPYSADCIGREEILIEIFWTIRTLKQFYFDFVLTENQEKINLAFTRPIKKHVLFTRL